MYFNSGSTTNSLVARIDRTCQTGVNSYPLADKASDCNEALDRFWYLAMTADGSWQIDDSNQTDLPSSTTGLNSGQRDYGLNTEMMVVEKVLVKNTAGDWSELLPIDIRLSQTSWRAKNIIQTPTADAGIPTHYDVSGRSLFLTPVPNYTQAASLKVFFKRGPSYFISTDTTKQPGIPSIFHNYIHRYASLQYLVDKGVDRKNDLSSEVQLLERAIVEHYSKRLTNEPTKLQPRRKRRG